MIRAVRTSLQWGRCLSTAETARVTRCEWGRGCDDICEHVPKLNGQIAKDLASLT